MTVRRCHEEQCPSAWYILRHRAVTGRNVCQMQETGRIIRARLSAIDRELELRHDIETLAVRPERFGKYIDTTCYSATSNG
jgi:hypothetical protein